MQKFLQFLLKSPYQAMILAGVTAGLSKAFLPLALVSGGILGLVTLRNRNNEGLVVLAGTVLITIMVGMFIDSKPGLPIPVVLFILPPIWLCAHVLRITESQGLLVITATGMAMLLAIGIHLVTGGAVEWWNEWLKVAVSGVQGASYDGFSDNGSIKFINGFVTMLFGVSIVISVLLARWGQSKLYNPGGFQEEFCRLRVPQVLFLLTLGLIALMAVINVNLMSDLLFISVGMFTFQGLAILHYNVTFKKANQFFLVPPYLLLIFVPQFIMVGLAFAASVDALMNFRKL